METNINRVLAPECESLAFSDNIDGYRQFAGPANVAQKAVISNEMGAALEKALALPLSELLDQINIAFAGGVNQIVLHGQTYTGNYSQTTWPGYLAFFLLFSNSYTPKQPTWELRMPDAIGYINRKQFISHKWQPRTDVVFFNKVSYTDPTLRTLYQPSDLVDSGYTYFYLNPHNLNESTATVSDNLLAAKSPAYQALVVDTYSNVTLEAVSKFQRLADSGLPIILCSGLPGYFPTANCSTKGSVADALQKLKLSKNVYTVSGEGHLAAKLGSLGIRPRVEVSTSGHSTWYPVMRTDDETDYIFVFNRGADSSGYINVNSTKTPYVLNSWTGERTALLHYQVEGTYTKVPLSLASNQTYALAFTDSWASEVATPSVHAFQAPSNILGYDYNKSNGLVVRTQAQRSQNSTMVLSNGKSISLNVNTTVSPITLSNWILVAEHWNAPQDMPDASLIAIKHNTTHHLTSLRSWLNIPGLHNASGVGYYSTQFSWPPTSHAREHIHRGLQSNDTSGVSGAYLSLPQITHGLKLFVNGEALETLDFEKPFVDIGPFLHHGNNHIEAVVPSLMWNYIRSIYNELEISGSKPHLTTLPSTVDTGLIGEAKIVPYLDHTISTTSGMENV